MVVLISKVKWVYEYIYYRSYSFFLKFFGEEDLPEYSASMSLSLKVIINLLSFLPWIITPSIFLIIPKIYVIVFCILIISSNIILFKSNNYYRRIFEKFNSESKKEKIKRGVVVWIYNIFSLLFLIISVYFTIEH